MVVVVLRGLQFHVGHALNTHMNDLEIDDNSEFKSILMYVNKSPVGLVGLVWFAGCWLVLLLLLCPVKLIGPSFTHSLYSSNLFV